MAPRARSVSSKDTSVAGSSDVTPSWPTWKYTKTMNMRDLARDDDYLSHLFVEKLGGLGTTPLMVHKMDPLRRLPKTDHGEILSIVQSIIHSRAGGTASIKEGVTKLLCLHSVRYFLRDYTQQQINAFATHASRYLELYLPNGSIEVAQTTRYSKWTGKSELCILATKAMAPGAVIAELKGSMADLTEEEDKELKCTGARNDNGVRRDFSVIHSKQLKKNHLFLGPARFVNHDCDHNCELFRTGRYITFRVLKPIAVGQEVTAHYGEGYFGRNNRHCLCETCERLGKGGYSQSDDDDRSSYTGSDVEEDVDPLASAARLPGEGRSLRVSAQDAAAAKAKQVMNQRSTRRGVYAILPDNPKREPIVKVEVDDSVNALTISPSISSTPFSAATSSDTQTRSFPGSDTSMMPPPSSSSAEAPLGKESTLFDVRTHRQSAISRRLTAAEVALREARSISASVPPPLVPDAQVQATADASTSNPSKPRRSSRTRKQPSRLTSTVLKVTPVISKPASIDEEGTNVAQASPEGRVLRGRQSAQGRNGPKVGDKIQSKEPERGSLKKTKQILGPTCFTCSNVLSTPSPSVNDSTSKTRAKDKVVKQECARCQRHFLIYAAPWPQRQSIGFNATPRENTPAAAASKLSHRSLPILDRKLREVVDSHKVRRTRADSQERPAKRQKVVHLKQAVYKGPARKLMARINESRFAAQLRRSKSLMDRMNRGPSHTLSWKHRGDEIARLKALNKMSFILGAPSKYQGSAMPDFNASTIGVAHRSNTVAVPATNLSQQDSSNAKRTIEGQKHTVDINQPTTTSISPTRLSKRIRNIGVDAELPSTNPTPKVAEEDFDDRRDKSFWPALPPLPPCGTGIKRLGLLNLRPNPTVVSRWRSTDSIETKNTEGTPQLMNDDSATDEDASDGLPTTPENDGSRSGPVVAGFNETRSRNVQKRILDVDDFLPGEAMDISDDEPLVPTSGTPPKRVALPALKGLGFSLKPNPNALSRRAWVHDGMVVDDENEHMVTLRSIRNQSWANQRYRLSNAIGSITADVYANTAEHVRGDDDLVSSGEEDVILPGSADSRRYTLQKSVTFSTDTLADTPTTPKQYGTDLPTFHSPSFRSPAKMSIRRAAVLGTSTQLHSDFLPCTTVPSSRFVDAGWDSTSDTSV